MTDTGDSTKASRLLVPLIILIIMLITGAATTTTAAPAAHVRSSGGITWRARRTLETLGRY